MQKNVIFNVFQWRNINMLFFSAVILQRILLKKIMDNHLPDKVTV